MTAVEKALCVLPKDQQSMLQQSFEDGLGRYFAYKPGRFVGVNCHLITNFIIEVQEGFWSLGILQEKKDESSVEN